ncbi:hypothetical protein PV350_04870 [Streptomyces sp. PA03-6a]|nr:hypothetical protein [Streptomyces sp. PA03-6a]
MKHWSERREQLCAWFTANGVDPHDIPINGDCTIVEENDQRTIRYEAHVRTPDGKLTLNERGTDVATEVRTAPLIVEPPDWWQPYEKPTREQLAAERDGAYRERAHLIALLAELTPGAVITPASDVDEDGWLIVYLTIGGHQASWHISPRDGHLFDSVELVEPDDPRARWNGHTTEEKYERIREYTARLAVGN